MGKLLLAAAVVLVVAWVGGGGGAAGGGFGFLVAAQGSAPVVFGDDLPAVMKLVSKERPSCAARSNLGDLCIEDEEYDQNIKQHALNLISRDTGMNSLLRDQSLRTILNDPETDASKDVDINLRFGTQAETPVCGAQEKIIYPKRGKTARDDWVFVLNQEGVQQALRVEKCVSDGSSCNIGMVLPGEAKATCRQKYVYRRLLVLGSNKIEPEQVLMPSCCVCYTTYQNLLPRSGNASGAGNQTPAETAGTAVPPPSHPLALMFDNSRAGRTRFISSPDRG